MDVSRLWDNIEGYEKIMRVGRQMAHCLQVASYLVAVRAQTINGSGNKFDKFVETSLEKKIRIFT